MGIGEPLIYGVTLPLGKPFISACIGGAFGGAVQAFFHVVLPPLVYLVYHSQLVQIKCFAI